MSIVDLHDIELLHNLLIDLDLSSFEGWNDFLTEIDGEDVVQLTKSLNLLVSL